MILYYAFGGGLGHLSRARAVLHTLRHGERAVLLTASPFAHDPRITGSIDAVVVPEAISFTTGQLQAWLSGFISNLPITEVFVDTFPFGILGELLGLPMPSDVNKVYIARLLKWQKYTNGLNDEPLHYDSAFILEPLTPEHRQYIDKFSRSVNSLTLVSPPSNLSSDITEQIKSLISEQGLWVVIHSGPDHEILDLVKYAEEMMKAEGSSNRLIVISPSRPEGLEDHILHLDIYPAEALLPLVDRIITGCGFNLMRETEPFSRIHRFMPFERRFDDQIARAAGRRSRNAD